MLADTHLDARRADVIVDLLGDRLTAADAILHAGDVTDAAVLGRLAEFAPVHAVDGNNDHGLDLTERLEIELDGIRIAMVHDSGSSTGRGRRLATWFPAADVVVFGHSHLPWNETVEVDGGVQHHFNPGSPTQRRRAPTRTVGWIRRADDGSPVCTHDHLDADG